jgi:hypothetical protein
MSDRKFAIRVLEEKGEVILTCNGYSMKPLIYPKEAIHIKRVDHNILRPGDAVFCKVQGNLQVHLISAIDSHNKRWQISNRAGFCNGWVDANAIFGLAVMVEDRVLVSDGELEKRAHQ